MKKKKKRPKKYIALEKKMIEFNDTHQSLAKYLGISERTLWLRRYGDNPWLISELVALQKKYNFMDAELLSFIFDEEVSA
ncbi:MAG: hypothetical protein PHE79_03310 [Eubacteriales bacterium]|nr:hypothetical protein [Eubacteriales bacterium]